MASNAVLPKAEPRRPFSQRRVTPTSWEAIHGNAEEPSFEELFREWSHKVASLKSIARKLLYEAEDPPCFGDLWTHRYLLSSAILELQEMVVDHFGDLEGQDFDSPAPQILGAAEAAMSDLIGLLHQWHGSPETQADMPPELLKSMQETLAGKTEDFDHGLHARSGGSK